MTDALDIRLLTEQEVIAALRLDVGRARPDEALRRLRRTGRLPAIGIGRPFLYRRVDVIALIESSLVRRPACAIIGAAKVSRAARKGG